MYGLLNGTIFNDLAVLNLCNTHNLGNIACFNSVCLHINWNAHVACDLNINVKGKGLLKVAGSYIHWKTDNISETVLDIHRGP